MIRVGGGGTSWSVTLGLAMVGVLAVAVLLGPLVAGDPFATDPALRLLPPSAAHWLGTDHLGRDQFARVVHGARTSLGAVAAIAVLVLGTGLVNVVIAIALSHWAWYARLAWGVTLSLRQRPYIAAARVAGGSPIAIVRRHVVPEVGGQLLVLATLDLGHWMLHVAGLSFLGLGVEAPMPEWGIMINDARPFVWTAPALIALPGAAILFTVVAFNLLGDAAHAKLDPRLDAHVARHLH